MGCSRLPETRLRAATLVAMAVALTLSACRADESPAACGGGAKACGSNADCGGFTCESGCCTTNATCTSDSDCTHQGDHCVGGTCAAGSGDVTCESSADCLNLSTTRVCNTSNKQCVECTRDGDCKSPSNSKTCSPTRTCVDRPGGCASDTDCRTAATGHKCKLTTKLCVECLGNTDCIGGNVCVQSACAPANGACADSTSCKDPTPACDTAARQCVACLDDAACGAGKKCTAHACVDAGCTADRDCATNAAAPKCDTGTKKCVACNAAVDCGDPTLACVAHACVPTQTGCQADAGCSDATSHCDVTSHQCVACVTAAQCPAGSDCTGNACVPHQPTGCTSDTACSGHAGTPKCETTSGNCVACLAGADCPSGLCDPAAHACQPGCAADANCAAPTAKCDTAAHQCVGCLAAGDCAAGQICQAGGCMAGCNANADCVADPGLKTCVAASHTCVACAASTDCPAGQTCTASACVPSSTTGDQPCGTNDTCPAGQTCLTDAASAKLCRVTCDPYAPGTSCAATKVCAWIGFGATDAATGACVPKNDRGAEGTTCLTGDDCENDLLCLPTSATAKKCGKLCNPQTGACAAGQSCHGLPAYIDPANNKLLTVGSCLPTASNLGKACSSDYSSSGADCGTGMTCGPNNLLADDSIRVSFCQYPYGTGQAKDACTDGAACITGDCLQGPKVCNTSCHWTSDCSRGGLASAYKCLPYLWFGTSPFTGDTNVSATGACLPTCKSDAGCAADRFCMLTPTFENSGKYQAGFYSYCFAKLGAATGPNRKAGQPCTLNADCASDECITNGRAGATDGYCFGSCDTAGTGQCDAAHGVTCDPAGTGLKLNNGSDGTAGTSDDQYGRAYICGGQSCTHDADCAGLSADATKARVCRLTLAVNGANTSYGASESLRTTCEPRVGTKKGGSTCTADGDCASGACFLFANGKRTCFGACTGSTDCATGSSCSQVNFGTTANPEVLQACAPN